MGNTIVKKTVLAVVVAVSFVGAAASASAMGVSVTPAQIELVGRSGTHIARTITVSNPSADVALFEVRADEFDRLVRVVPSSFVLEAGASREVTVAARAARDGRFSTTISISARPLGAPDFSAAAGVRVPFALAIQPSAPLLASLLFGLRGFPLAFLLGAALVVCLALAAGLFRYGIKAIR